MCAHINTYNKSRFLQHHVTEWTVTVTSTNTHKGAHTHIHACAQTRTHTYSHSFIHSFIHSLTHALFLHFIPHTKTMFLSLHPWPVCRHPPQSCHRPEFQWCWVRWSCGWQAGWRWVETSHGAPPRSLSPSSALVAGRRRKSRSSPAGQCAKR